MASQSQSNKTEIKYAGQGKKSTSSDPKNLKMIGPLNQKQFNFSLWYFVIAIGAMLFFNILLRTPEQTIEFSEFKSKVVSGEIKRVELRENYFIGLPHTGAELKEIGKKGGQAEAMPTHYRTIPVSDPSFIELMDQNGVEYYTRPVTFGESVFRTLMSWVIPILILVILWRFLMPKMGGMGGGVMSFGKNRAQILAEGDTGVTFDDVAGTDEAKEELQETIDFLKNPRRYEAIGGKLPKGVLLVGPPGTGKTMLAKAVAGEARVPFFKISGSEFVEMFVGVGAARVRDLFKQAKEKAPCIVFIDELDAIGKSRGASMMGHDEREQTLNQLLVEMDGFDSHGGVIILAATNRPEVLDPALLRPGRFDRQVLVDRPDLIGREAILQVHARDVKLDDSTDLKKVAQSTAGFSGADLANLVNEAAILAVRKDREKVLQDDFDEAIERLVAGLEKKNRLINPKEKKIVAYHETGHALVAAFTPGAEPVHKISIVPRGLSALGYTMQTPTSDRFLITEKEILGKIDVLLGGRAAESIIFDQVSSGAANDLSQATEIARTMIMDYGMSEKFRNMTLSSRQPTILDKGGLAQPTHIREHSESTQQYIDETIAETIEQRFELVVSLLEEKKDLLQEVAEKLLELETMNASQFQELIMDRKNEQF